MRTVSVQISGTTARWRFGELVGRYVLYLGESRDMEDGVLYRNAEEFLEALPQIRLLPGLAELPDMRQGENGAQGFQITM